MFITKNKPPTRVVQYHKEHTKITYTNERNYSTVQSVLTYGRAPRLLGTPGWGVGGGEGGAPAGQSLALVSVPQLKKI